MIEDDAAAAAQLDATLSSLTQLTQLFLQTLDYCARLPPALAGLEHLRSFSWSFRKLREPQLPAGPWLASLRQLSLPIECLATSPEQLAQLQQLEELELLCGGSNGHTHAPPPWQLSTADLDVVRWAVRHPRLRRLSPTVLSDMPPAIQCVLDEAQHGNPALHVDFDDGMLHRVVFPRIYGHG